jgi:hypothetical protein
MIAGRVIWIFRLNGSRKHDVVGHGGGDEAKPLAMFGDPDDPVMIGEVAPYRQAESVAHFTVSPFSRGSIGRFGAVANVTLAFMLRCTI